MCYHTIIIIIHYHHSLVLKHCFLFHLTRITTLDEELCYCIDIASFVLYLIAVIAFSISANDIFSQFRSTDHLSIHMYTTLPPSSPHPNTHISLDDAIYLRHLKTCPQHPTPPPAAECSAI